MHKINLSVLKILVTLTIVCIIMDFASHHQKQLNQNVISTFLLITVIVSNFQIVFMEQIITAGIHNL